MAIELNHTIVPAHDKIASAKFFARVFGLAFDEAQIGYFAPVRVNETLTLDFDDDVDRFDVHHYAFKVSEAEFDAIFGRIQAEGIPYGSEPHALTNRDINHRGADGASTFATRTAISSNYSPSGKAASVPTRCDG